MTRHIGTHPVGHGEPVLGAGLTLGPNQVGTRRSIFHSLKIYFLTGTLLNLVAIFVVTKFSTMVGKKKMDGRFFFMYLL